jgi:acyl-CoA thioester hydrolase
MTHRCEIAVRSYECDGYNHVNNAVYLNYLEHARMEFLKDSGFDFAAFTRAGYGLIVARICIDYRQPAYTFDRLTVETTSIKRRRTYGVFRQTVLRDGAVVAEAEVTWAAVNSSGKPCPLPEGFALPSLEPEVEA